ncbi:hypothetical protein Tco_0017708 [Tanacetum coccineum]
MLPQVANERTQPLLGGTHRNTGNPHSTSQGLFNKEIQKASLLSSDVPKVQTEVDIEALELQQQFDSLDPSFSSLESPPPPPPLSNQIKKKQKNPQEALEVEEEVGLIIRKRKQFGETGKFKPGNSYSVELSSAGVDIVGEDVVALLS